MSASEKLKILSEQHDGTTPYVLEEALPQIRAVVEAAEQTVGVGLALHTNLPSALAALDEALS